MRRVILTFVLLATVRVASADPVALGPCNFGLFVPYGLSGSGRAARQYIGIGGEGSGHNSPTRIITNWLNSGEVKGQKIAIPNGNQEPQRLLFITPPPNQLQLDHYAKNLAAKTVAFGYVSGWFHGAEGAPPFHAYARVGERLFHFMPDGVIYESTFLETQNSMLNREAKPIPVGASEADTKRIRRGNNPVTFETVFEMPDRAMSDLIKYYRDRKAGAATIDGVTTTPPYNVAGFGQMDESMPVENCVTFALSFTQSHWAKDYPGMQLVRRSANINQLPGGDILNGTTIPQFYMAAKPLAVVVFGKDASEPGYRPEIDMLEQLRVMRRQKLTATDIRIEKEWSPTPTLSIPVWQ